MLMKTSIGFRLLGDGDLMIVNGNESHEGKYLCQANNGVGSGKSKLISINVDGKREGHNGAESFLNLHFHIKIETSDKWW